MYKLPFGCDAYNQQPSNNPYFINNIRQYIMQYLFLQSEIIKLIENKVQKW